MIRELNKKYPYTVKDASEMLDYHPDHIRRLARQCRLEYVKIGWEYRFSKEMLYKYIEDNFKKSNVK